MKILVINPGSTSTKFAVYEDKKELLLETIRHNHKDLAAFNSIGEQYPFRAKLIKESLQKSGIDTKELSAVIGRGGLLKPIPGGVWKVNTKMINDLKKGVMGEHASNLGGILAWNIAEKEHIPAFIADPVVVDELQDTARIAGHPDFSRLSIFHALNQKASARRAADELGKTYEECNFIVAHMGGGISVGAHRKGAVVDVNNALNGDGPFSPERSGGLPAGQLVGMCFSGKYTEKEMMKKLKGNGGFKAYLGTADGSEVEKRIKKGDTQAALIMNAMGYQVAKEIGSLSAVLKGDIDGIILTGGLAYSMLLTEYISSHVSFLGKIFMYPGENEMEALREGVLRVMNNEETAKEY